MTRAFAEWLAPLPAVLPDVVATSPKDNATLRWAVRADGGADARALVFVSNVQPFVAMEPQVRAKMSGAA